MRRRAYTFTRELKRSPTELSYRCSANSLTQCDSWSVSKSYGSTSRLKLEIGLNLSTSRQGEKSQPYKETITHSG